MGQPFQLVHESCTRAGIYKQKLSFLFDFCFFVKGVPILFQDFGLREDIEFHHDIDSFLGLLN